MVGEVINKLKSLGAVTFPPANKEDISHIRNKLLELRFSDFPKDYIEFLSITDGLIWDGVEIYGTKSRYREDYDYTFDSVLVNNKNVIKFKYMQDRLFIGRTSENIILYCSKHKHYHAIDRLNISVKDSFDSIRDLFLCYFNNVI